MFIIPIENKFITLKALYPKLVKCIVNKKEKYNFALRLKWCQLTGCLKNGTRIKAEINRITDILA